MKQFIVTVNGKSYQVEVEEVGKENVAAPAAIPAPKAAPKAAPAPTTQVAAPAAAVPSDVITVKAPMPGNILNVRVNEGDAVKKGDVLFILEAMKMENEIMAPQDATVVSVMVQKGAKVNADEVLAALK